MINQKLSTLKYPDRKKVRVKHLKQSAQIFSVYCDCLDLLIFSLQQKSVHRDRYINTQRRFVNHLAWTESRSAQVSLKVVCVKKDSYSAEMNVFRFLNADVSTEDHTWKWVDSYLILSDKSVKGWMQFHIFPHILKIVLLKIHFFIKMSCLLFYTFISFLI